MRDFFFKDWAWKLFSLALAVVIWFTVHRIVVDSTVPKASGDISPLTYYSLPVSLVSSSGNVRNYRALQPVVSVTVSGPREIIATLQANQIHALVDLTETNMANNEKQPVEVTVPPGVTLVSVKPAEIGILPPP